jgi:hypothetical protein
MTGRRQRCGTGALEIDQREPSGPTAGRSRHQRRIARPNESKRSSMATYKGECFCGAVHIEVTGDPEGMGYCHCRSCRSWFGAPVNAFTLWKPDAVRITAETEHVSVFQKTPLSQRHYCNNCGGHLMNHHPTIGLTDVFAAMLPSLRFAPGLFPCKMACRS